MMKTIRTLALVAAALVVATVRPAAAQSASLQGDLLKDWTNMKTTMTKIADAMPEDKYGFKPTPAQRSFGEQMMHVAGANVMLIKALGAKAPPPALNMKATTRRPTSSRRSPSRTTTASRPSRNRPTRR